MEPDPQDNAFYSRIFLQAYEAGLFPMSEREDNPEIFWVRPQLRAIIPLKEFHEPQSLTKIIKRKTFEIRINSNFDEVIRGCSETHEKRPSTWINKIIREAFAELFKWGHCHTIEAWQNEKIVGGLYGLAAGRVFFGESMFSRKANASKACLSFLVQHMKERGFELLDIQFMTDHLKRFGAIEIAREEFEMLLRQALTGTPAYFQ